MRQRCPPESAHQSRVVLVHGAIWAGRTAWRRQASLSPRWKLVVLDRGWVEETAEPVEDIASDATLVADALDGGAHLVGHSTGGIAALLAAAQRPERVHSLTVCEPLTFQLCPDDPDVDVERRRWDDRLDRPTRCPTRWLSEFAELFGTGRRFADPLPASLARGVQSVRAIRLRPWEVDLPLTGLKRTSFPKLVVSGGHNSAIETACNALASVLGAERAVVTGAGHAVAATGSAFNDCVERFLADASAKLLTRPTGSDTTVTGRYTW